MASYLARLLENHELVGFFHVDSDEELFWLIDECCDPNAVEIAELSSGGLYWGQRVELKVPVPLDENGEGPYDGLPQGASFTESWGETFFSNPDEVIWRPVPIIQDLD